MVMRAKMGALPSAFGLPFCIINRIENVLLSIGANFCVMSGYLAYCTALQTCLKQCNTLWQSVLYTANITSHFGTRKRFGKKS
jgi:hypothetical protein